MECCNALRFIFLLLEMAEGPSFLSHESSRSAVAEGMWSTQHLLRMVLFNHLLRFIYFNFLGSICTKFIILSTLLQSCFAPLTISFPSRPSIPNSPLFKSFIIIPSNLIKKPISYSHLSLRSESRGVGSLSSWAIRQSKRMLTSTWDSVTTTPFQ